MLTVADTEPTLSLTLAVTVRFSSTTRLFSACLAQNACRDCYATCSYGDIPELV